MDKTHLRFFTLKTDKELIEEVGYSVKEADAIIANKITKRSSKLGYQFIIVETKKEVKNE